MEHPLEEIVLARNELPLQWANDYRLYRVRTARKVARLRKSFNLQQRPVKSNGKKVQRSGKTITVEDVTRDSGVCRVLLCLAERAWAEAMRTSTLQESRAGLQISSKKDHVRSKLAKAVGYVTEAIKLIEEAGSVLEGPGGASTELELYAYSSLISGHHAYETHRWANCIKNYSIARVSLLALVNQAQDSGLKELLLDIISTVVDEHLIYSVYQLEKVRPLRVGNIAKKAALDQADSHPAIGLIKQIDASVLSTESLNPSENNRQDTVTWRNHTAKIVDDDVSAAIFATVKQDAALESKINTSGSLSASIPLFDEVLESWQDTQDLVKANIKRWVSSNASPHDRAIQDQYIVSTFTGYSMLLRRIQRDTLLLNQLNAGSNTSNKTKKHKDGKISRKVFDKTHDLVRIHDTILQSTKQLLELSGVHNDSDLLESLTTLDTYYKAKRLELIAHAYFLAGQYKESLALNQKGLENISALGSSTIPVAFPQGVLDKSMLEAAITQLNTRTIQLQAVMTADQIKKNSQSSSGAVIDSLGSYPSNATTKQIASNLVTLNSTLEPVFVKPVFFDIAFNYIDYNNHSKNSVLNRGGEISSSATSAKESTQNEGKKGFLKGLWGR